MHTSVGMEAYLETSGMVLGHAIASEQHEEYLVPRQYHHTKKSNCQVEHAPFVHQVSSPDGDVLEY